MTEEISIHRQLMRMHGFSLMSMTLTDMADDRDVVLKVCSARASSIPRKLTVRQALQSMARWKTQIRNKIEDSKVEEPVALLAKSDDQEIRTLAKQVSDLQPDDGVSLKLILYSCWTTGPPSSCHTGSLVSPRLPL